MRSSQGGTRILRALYRSQLSHPWEFSEAMAPITANWPSNQSELNSPNFNSRATPSPWRHTHQRYQSQSTFPGHPHSSTTTKYTSKSENNNFIPGFQAASYHTSPPLLGGKKEAHGIIKGPAKGGSESHLPGLSHKESTLTDAQVLKEVWSYIKHLGRKGRIVV